MLKRTIFTITFILSLMLAGRAFSQIALGVKAGGGLAQSYLKYPVGLNVNQEFVIGKTAGLRFRYLPKSSETGTIGIAAGVIIEANFTQKGWKEMEKTILLDKTKLEEPIDIEKKISYIELPFLTHIEVGRKKVRFIVNLGPQLAYSIGSTETHTKAGVDFTPTDYSFPSSSDKRFEFAISGGTGLSIYSKKGIFNLEARYTQSLTDMKDVKVKEQITWAKSQFFNVTIGYSIVL